MNPTKSSDSVDSLLEPLLAEEDDNSNNRTRANLCQVQIGIHNGTQNETTARQRFIGNVANRLNSFKIKKIQIGLLLFTIFIIIFIEEYFSDPEILVFHRSHLPGLKGYLVFSDKCKIPDLDPYIPEMMQYFDREDYDPCLANEPLTRVEYNSTAQMYLLSLNYENFKYYTHLGGSPKCCYQVIWRNFKGDKADTHVSFSKCKSFSKPVLFSNVVDNILVKCQCHGVQVYANGHAMIQERPEIRKRLSDWKDRGTQKPISVLMVGIDSISRINLIRAMPRTAQYLYDNEWFELTGYNKIDDGTFSNLMAMLTGYNFTSIWELHNPTVVGKLDKCPILWKRFQENGYVTAYAEDQTSMSTFNWLKVGFEKPPVDYYLRPFLIGAEKYLYTRTKSGLKFCLGLQHSADFVYDYALEFDSRYSNDPYFGLFWTNTFSHNDIDDPTSMDLRILEYLKEFSKRGILDRSIVVFFSDHGMRFGPTRRFFSGHIEERLPFLFLWLPLYLKRTFPEFVNALNVNKNRLTNPFDMHMTLQHFLKLSGRTEELKPAVDCPKCQTLLEPVPYSRSCEDINIVDHWCTCLSYDDVNVRSNIALKTTEFVLDDINQYVATYRQGTVAKKCATLTLNSIQHVYRAIRTPRNDTTEYFEIYRVVFVTNPNRALFEATVTHEVNAKRMTISGSISRLDYYSRDSACVPYRSLKKYCSCK